MDTVATATPQRIIRAAAPIRICDTGGWSDTWFAGHGTVFNIAVTPGAEVAIVVYPRAARRAQVVLHAENYGERLALVPGQAVPPSHRLLAAAVSELPPPEDIAVEVSIYSEVPAGCSTGTSAAVCVALLAALDRLTPGQMTAHELAYAAHRVETHRLGLQSGIQDQLCAAYGGVNFIEMFAYPHASVSQLRLPEATLWELEHRLMLVYLGRTHSSSAVHEMVITGLEAEGAGSPRLERLRRTAHSSRDALYAGDLAALGASMSECTAGQADLHPGLVSQDAWRAIEVARRHGALGWKVNGAGGEGGSLTILCGEAPGSMRLLAAALAAADPRLRTIPIRLCPWGGRAWETTGKAGMR
ncbi:MAG: GHMP kinase [Chloroflexales bacterium]|nr:GHMP kinase [Chloroflexales bacterium]